MKFKLQDIKAQEKYDNLYSMIKKAFPKNIQEAETAPGSDEEKLLDWYIYINIKLFVIIYLE